MSQTINVPRDVLQTVLDPVCSEDWFPACKQIRALLAAPLQPEGDGLTRYGLGIVGGIAAFVSADDGCMVLHEDAQRAIAELREECERLRVKLMTIASAEPGRHNIEWAKAMAATGNNEAHAKWREAFDQCGRLAELLRQARLKMAYMLKHGEWHSPEELIERIDAALAEVK